MSLLKKSWFYLTAIFLVGLVTGGILGATLVRRQMMQPLQLDRLGARVERELIVKLDLDAEQQKKIHPLTVTTMNRIERIYYDTMRKVDAAVRDAEEKLLPDLRPDQMEKLQKLARTREEFIRQRNPLSPPIETGK